MEPRHEDDAAMVRLIDLHLPVWVLIAVDPCPRAPPIARSPRSDFSSGSLGSPDPCVARCPGATGIDEKDEARAANMLHAVSDRDFRPVPSSVKALNNQAPLLPGHEQMIWIIGIDDGRIETCRSRQAPRDSWSSLRRRPRISRSQGQCREYRPNRELEAVQPHPAQWRALPRHLAPAPPCPVLIGPDHVQAIVDRLPDALTMKLRKKIGWSRGVRHHGDRADNFRSESVFTRSTPLGVTSVHVPLAATCAASSCRDTDRRLGRTLRATAKVL